MDTREQIIEVANNLLVERGFNAFSYKNIAEKINIKTSSIHYHFPTKTDLGIAVIQKHKQFLAQAITKTQAKTATEKLSNLFSYYKQLAIQEKVCIVGALTSDINTLDESLRCELLSFSHTVIDWTKSILEEGEAQKKFKPLSNIALKAKHLIANLMALVQFSRIEKNQQSFDLSIQLLFNELIIQ